MKINPTGFEGLFTLEPKVFGDHRGYFFESYNQATFAKLGLDPKFVQDNESYSKFGTLRGLHFQMGEHAQGKLVRVVEGSVFDVAVDIRPTSATFGKWFGVELSAENKKMFWVPRGFAHGFVVTSPTAVFQYKCDNFYRPTEERGIAYADKDIGVRWPVAEADVILSDKDKQNLSWQQIKGQL